MTEKIKQIINMSCCIWPPDGPYRDGLAESQPSGRNQPDNGHIIDHIQKRKAGKNNVSDKTESHWDLPVLPALGNHCHTRDDTGRHHNCDQCDIACDHGSDAVGKTGIENDDRHNCRRVSPNGMANG